MKGNFNRLASFAALVLVATLIIPSQYLAPSLFVQSALSGSTTSLPQHSVLSQIHELSSMTQILPLFSIPNAYADSVLATIPFSNAVTGIAVNPNTNTVYVTNGAANSLSVIDGRTNSITATISLPHPQGVAVNPTTNTIYVANYQASSVTVINGATNSITTTIPIPNSGAPYAVGVNPNTNTIYVTDVIHTSVYVINGATNSITATIPLPAPFSTPTVPYYIAVNPTTNTIYVSGWTSNISVLIVDVISGATNAVTTIPVSGIPTGVAVNPTTNTAYVAINGASNSASLSVINGATNSITTSIPLSSPGTNQYVAVNTNTNTIYATDFESNSILEISGSSNSVTATIPLASAYTIAVNPNTNRVYVGNEASPFSVSVIGTLQQTTTSIVSSPNPSTVGQSVTFTAGITPSTAGGTITFTVDGTQGSPITVSGGTATFSTSSLAVGSHTITAAYSGDANNLPSTSSTLSQSVIAAPVQLPTCPLSITGSVTITISCQIPSGSTMNFNYYATLTINPGVIVSNSGTISNTSYGDAINNSGIILNNVGGAINNAYGTAFNNNSGGVINNSGGTITNAGNTFNNNSGGIINNSGGTMWNGGYFNNSGNINNSGTFNNNKGTLATGGGQGTFNNNSGGTFNNNSGGTLNENLISDTFNNNSGGIINNSGGTITNDYGNTINNNSGGIINNGIPSYGGTITNNSGGVINNSGAINNNVGTITNNGTINEYCGSTFTGASVVGTPLTSVPCQAPTTTAVASSANPSTFGQSVTFTATISPTPTTGDTVTFYDGTTNIGTGITDSTGKAALSISSLSTGSHSITATFAGDANFATSTSKPALAQTVQDTTPPVVTVPSDITTSATSSSGATVTFTATATDPDDAASTPICNPASGSTFPIGTTKVTCSSTDTHGNTGTGTFTVTVQDITPPTLTLPPDITQEATGPSGNVVSYTATATDIVDGTDPVTCTPASGSTFPLGTTTVNCSSTDAHGNTASGTFNVKIQDTTPPALTLPSDITQEATGPSGNVVSYTATATDIVDGTDPVTCDHASGNTFPLGTTTVTCTSTDKAGNTAHASFTITVAETTAPSITSSDITQEATGPSGAVATFSATATDIVDGTDPVTCNPASGSTFALGTTIVTCTSTNHAGNTGTGTFKVTVQDTTPPTITAPPSITKEATGPQTTVNLGTATATDLVDGSVPVTNNAPATFPVGTTIVTYTATDSHGNTAHAKQIVTITDTTPPTLTLPSSITVPPTSIAGAVVTFTATAIDLVDGPVPVTCNPASGSTFVIGTTKVICTATDSHQNTATGLFTVTVQTPAQAIQSLIKIKESMNLDKGTMTSLDAKLSAAYQSLSSNNTVAAKNQLNAFINQVNALTGTMITQYQATILTQFAQNIINSIH